MQMNRTRTSVMMAALLLALGVIMSVGVMPTFAQEATPTPTQNTADPVWRGFTTARAALEEEFNVDLTYVRAWTFSQVEWKVSIDSCNEEVATVDYRPVYFGWDYVITSLQNRTWRVRVSFDLKAVSICTREETAAAPGATLPPVSGQGATGAFEVGGHVLSLTTEASTAMKNARMTWMKKQVRWNIGGSTSQAKGFIDAGKGGGFKVMLSIVARRAR